MTTINNKIPEQQSIQSQTKSNEQNINAHYSDNMKVSRPKLGPCEAPKILKLKKVYSDKEATNKLQQINTDIYEGTKKEMSNHDFSFSTFFKIFGGISIIAILIACMRKFRGGK